jgi:hypothetical protein
MLILAMLLLALAIGLASAEPKPSQSPYKTSTKETPTKDAQGKIAICGTAHTVIDSKLVHRWSGTMAQLTYDEIRLLRELKNSNRKISGNKPHEGLNQLAKEGYVTSRQLNISEALYSITAKGLAALHDAEGND